VYGKLGQTLFSGYLSLFTTVFLTRLSASHLGPVRLSQAKIAAELPGRTDNEVKNFWNGRQKRLLRTKQLAAMAAARRHSKPAPPPRPSSTPPISWLPAVRDHPAAFLSGYPPSPATAFFPPPLQPAPLVRTAPPPSPITSSAGSVHTAESFPRGTVGSSPAQGQAHMPLPPYRRFLVPPLIIPEVEPLEGDLGGPPDMKQVFSAPRWAAPAPQQPPPSLYPPYSCTQPPLLPSLSAVAPAWRHDSHPHPYLGEAFPAFPPPALSPPPKPPVVRLPMPDVDSFIVSPLVEEEEEDMNRRRFGDVILASRKRSRGESHLTSDEVLGRGDVPVGKAWHTSGRCWEEQASGEDGWPISLALESRRGTGDKGSWADESEGECDSGMTHVAPRLAAGEETHLGMRMGQLLVRYCCLEAVASPTS
jgi:hypothetical protein